jgi:hypothetical protein
MTHRTHHMAEPVLGRVLVACSCGWTDWVDVSDLPY